MPRPAAPSPTRPGGPLGAGAGRTGSLIGAGAFAFGVLATMVLTIGLLAVAGLSAPAAGASGPDSVPAQVPSAPTPPPVAPTPSSVTGHGTAPAATPDATTPFALEWQSATNLGDAPESVALSSPTAATFSGTPGVVVGDRKGELFAFSLETGATIPGWPVDLGAAIDASPTVGPTGDIFVGAGSATDPDSPAGGYYAISPSGKILWHASVVNPVTDTGPATGVEASLAAGTLGGTPTVVAGSLGQEAYALDPSSGATLPGWPFFDSDSVFSTPALDDLYGTGQTEIIEGAAQTAGVAYGYHYSSGGHVRILDDRGDLVCDYDADQAVNSSPAVGDFLPGGAPGIVVGTGDTFPGAPQTDAVLALNDDCGLAWQTTLDGETWSSPALADVTGTGQLDVVEGTVTGPHTQTGSVYVLDAATGAVEWSASTTGAVWGSVTTADVTTGGGGVQDLFVPTISGVDVFNGKTGAMVAVLDASTSTAIGQGYLGFQNSPLVTDTDGTVGITVVGYGGKTPATYVEHFELTGATAPTATAATAAVGPGTWPEFHHDPQHTGDAGTPSPATSACTVPSAVGDGYQLAGSDGGVYSFGQPFCGSMGGTPLDAPVVGAASAPGTGGYWLVASDGGIFAFGGAQFYGSMGGTPLDAPVVGMAATRDGNGYWLVASDGGVFAFGGAQFYGSMGGKPLNAPVVGMAATPDGRGYWLVAADGGIFAFGDASFYGSMGGKPLNAPVVGMAADLATGGYWEVAADGGVFSYFAPFYGSTGGLVLDAPVVGMAATENGDGYRFVAADGGVFAYGDAAFDGSMGGRPINAPIVGMAG
jgi:PQQ enzyme repeat